MKEYSKEEFATGENEYQFSNNSNFNDNGSSFFDTNNRGKQEDGFDSFKSNDFDYKLKNEFDSEDNYDNFTANPK